MGLNTILLAVVILLLLGIAYLVRELTKAADTNAKWAVAVGVVLNGLATRTTVDGALGSIKGSVNTGMRKIEKRLQAIERKLKIPPPADDADGDGKSDGE